MDINPVFGELASQESLERTVTALKGHGIEALIVETAEDAKHKALELIPKSAEVMNMTSQTLEEIGRASCRERV